MIILRKKDKFSEIEIIKYVLNVRKDEPITETYIDKHIKNNMLDLMGTFVSEEIEEDTIYTVSIDNAKSNEVDDIYSYVILLKFTHFFLENIEIFNNYYIKSMILEANPFINLKIKHMFKELNTEEMVSMICDEFKNICTEIIYKTDNLDEKLYIIEFLNNLNLIEWERIEMNKEKDIIHIFPALNMGVKALIIINKYLHNKICNQQQDLL